MELYIGLGVIWFFGLTGYIITNKMDKYNNMKYYNVSDKLRKYKRVSKKLNDSNNKLF